MSNVCCGMFNVVVKAPDDLLTKTPNLNGNDLVIRSFRQWVVLQVHRTSHNRHSTFDSFGCRQFFTVSMSARFSCNQRNRGGHRPPLQRPTASEKYFLRTSKPGMPRLSRIARNALRRSVSCLHDPVRA